MNCALISIIIERRDYGGVLSEHCEDTEQSFEKVSKVRETVLRTRNCQTRPKLSCKIASGEQFSLQVSLKRWQRWRRGHRGWQAVPHPSRRHRKSAVANGGETKKTMYNDCHVFLYKTCCMHVLFLRVYCFSLYLHCWVYFLCVLI